MAYEERAYRPAAAGESHNMLAVGIVLFAAVFMAISGAFQVLQGLAAIIDDDFFVIRANYAYDLDVSAWGWLHLIIGAVVMITGVALLSGALWARIAAMFVVVVAAIVNFVFIPYEPVWTIVQLVIYGIVLWALLANASDWEEA
jgi:hypothetical protein